MCTKRFLGVASLLASVSTHVHASVTVPARFDVGLAGTSLPSGFTPVVAASTYSPAAGFGWVGNVPSHFERNGPFPAFVRNVPDELILDGAQSANKFEFRVDLAAGDYVCVVYLGDLGNDLQDPLIPTPLKGMDVLVNGNSVVTGAFARLGKGKARYDNAEGAYKRVTFPASTISTGGLDHVTLTFETTAATPVSVLGLEVYAYAEPPIWLDPPTGNLVVGAGFSVLAPAVADFNDRNLVGNYAAAKAKIDALALSGNEMAKAWGYAWLAGWLTGKEIAPGQATEEPDLSMLTDAQGWLAGLGTPDDIRVAGLLADIQDFLSGELFIRSRAYLNYPPNPASFQNQLLNLNAGGALLEQIDRSRSSGTGTPLRVASPLRARAQYMIGRSLYSRSTFMAIITDAAVPPTTILNADYNQYLYDVLDGLWPRLDPSAPLSSRWYARAYEPALLAWFVRTYAGLTTIGTTTSRGPIGAWDGQWPALDYTDTFWHSTTGIVTPNSPWNEVEGRYAKHMRAVGTWWVENRLVGAELGGGLGDDVESFAVLVIPTIVRSEGGLLEAGARTVFEHVLDTPSIGGAQGVDFDQGYAANVMDVEHAAEYTTNPLFVLMPSHYGNPKFVEFAMRCMRNLDEPAFPWAPHTSGSPLRRFFNSWHFGAHGNTSAAAPNWDICENIKAIIPGFNLIDYNGSPYTRTVFAQIARGWAHLAMRTDFGKPVGIFPVSYDPVADTIGNNGLWYTVGPGIPWAPVIDGTTSRTYSLLTSAYESTQDWTLLQPIFEAVKFLDANPPVKSSLPNPGHVSHLLKGPIASNAFQAKAGLIAEAANLSTEPPAVQLARLNNVIDTYGGSYEKFFNAPPLPSGLKDKTALKTAFGSSVDWLEHFWPFATTIVAYTDRVNIGPLDTFWTLFGVESGGPYSTVPSSVVAWSKPATNPGPLDFSLLVNALNASTASGGGSIQLILYNRGSTARDIDFRILRKLSPGNYDYREGADLNGDDAIDSPPAWASVPLNGPNTTFRVSQVPAGVLHIVELVQTSAPPGGPTLLMDLAVDAAETRRVGNQIEVFVHNIGSAPYTTSGVDQLRVFENGVFKMAMTIPSLQAPGITSQDPQLAPILVPLNPAANATIKLKLRIQSTTAQITTQNDESSAILP